MRKAHEYFRKHFQNHKITGRKNVRGLTVLIFQEAQQSQAKLTEQHSLSLVNQYISLTQKEEYIGFFDITIFFLSFMGKIWEFVLFSQEQFLPPSPLNTLFDACSTATLEIANVECSGGEGDMHGNLTLGCYKKNILKIDKTVIEFIF